MPPPVFPSRQAPWSARLSQGGPPVWIRVQYLFTGEELLRDQHLVFDRRQILHLNHEPPDRTVLGDERSSPDSEYVDLAVFPGLIESHAHLFLEGGETNVQKRAASLQLDNHRLLDNASQRLPELLSLGIFAIRDAGDKSGVGLALQNSSFQDSGQPIPYIDSPGAALYHQGRYGSFMGEPIENAGSIEKAVEERARKGAKRIKFLVTGIINFEKGRVTAKPQIESPELKQGVLAAHRLNLPTFAHCSGADGVEICLAGGVGTLEHGFFMEESQLPRLRDARMAWVPTFAPVQFQRDEPQHVGWSAVVLQNLDRILDDHAKLLLRAADLGVLIVAGSDAGSHGVSHGIGFLRELALMQDAGLPALRVLRAATADSAKVLGYEEVAGVVKQGGPARFVLGQQGIVSDIRRWADPAIIVFDGWVMEREAYVSPPGL